MAKLREKESLDYAKHCDDLDPLQYLRKEFLIPSIQDLNSDRLTRQAYREHFVISPKSSSKYGKRAIDSFPKGSDGDESEPCIYFCGNSLGLQPRRTADLVQEHLSTWASKGVLGHFTKLQDSALPPWLDVDDDVARLMAPIVGALTSEVAVMETLTANLHLMMASFYRPTKDKFKIILEGKAFPSDHYAINSQVLYHGYDPADAMVILESDDPHSPTLDTDFIIASIRKHADKTALIILPGIQYYTGQLFDIKAITQYAHSHNISVGWDLAHAAGNAELRLHDWNVDFAVWCNYKYLNSGPGAIASLFVHERHGKVDLAAVNSGSGGYHRRLAGWWGGDKNIRFQMADRFVPRPGAAGFQLGNPCALALTAVRASLEVFAKTTMSDLRQKSLKLSNYLEELLDVQGGMKYQILTPMSPAERGAQLSLRVHPESMEAILAHLAKKGVVVDERKPDVIRVAPTPLYNTFVDVYRFVKIFREACLDAQPLS